jgi:hypothetical protein
MSIQLLEKAASLHEEADELLRKYNLLAMLSSYGEVLVHGSYRYDLMTWRDLDIFLAPSEITLQLHFEIGDKLASSLTPVQMLCIDSIHNRDTKVPGLECLYWGLDILNPSQRNWKLDICLVAQEVLSERRALCENISSRLTDETRTTILRIKTDLLSHPKYVRHILNTSRGTISADPSNEWPGDTVPVFYSANVYTAVIDAGVSTTNEFLDYLVHPWH